MLIIMEDRDIECLFQSFFYLETTWGTDILQVNTSKYRSNSSYCLNDFLSIFGSQAYWEGIYPGKVFKEDCLAFHNRNGCLRTYIPQSQHCRSI